MIRAELMATSAPSTRPALRIVVQSGSRVVCRERVNGDCELGLRWLLGFADVETDFGN